MSFAAFIAVLVSSPAAGPNHAEVFEQRIVPIFNSPNPSSCVQCHLGGVDLKQYILPDAEKTFRSLRDQGLIDLDNPAKSKIVKLIDMGGAEANGPNAVHAKTREMERDAFVAWLTACAADPKLRATPKIPDGEAAKPARPDAVIRHARKDRVLQSFEENVWAWRFRCMNCHTEGTPQNEKFRKEHGDRVAWVKKAGAGETMDYLIASKLIDAANPEKSLLLRKPLGEKHEGGIKFVVGDDAYKGFRKWIEDVAAIRTDRYTAAKDLPAAINGPAKFGTDIWFKLDQTHPEWGDKFLLARVFAWDDRKQAWEDSPIAVTDRMVFGKGRIWQHNLTLFAAKDSDRAKAWRAGKPLLPEGRYLVKVYVDRDGRLAKDWTAELREEDYAGKAEFRARWRDGYGAMTVVNAGTVRK